MIITTHTAIASRTRTSAHWPQRAATVASLPAPSARALSAPFQEAAVSGRLRHLAETVQLATFLLLFAGTCVAILLG